LKKKMKKTFFKKSSSSSFSTIYPMAAIHNPLFDKFKK
jgi:hypothetical protein